MLLLHTPQRRHLGSQPASQPGLPHLSAPFQDTGRRRRACTTLRPHKLSLFLLRVSYAFESVRHMRSTSIHICSYRLHHFPPVPGPLSSSHPLPGLPRSNPLSFIPEHRLSPRRRSVNHLPQDFVFYLLFSVFCVSHPLRLSVHHAPRTTHNTQHTAAHHCTAHRSRCVAVTQTCAFDLLLFPSIWYREKSPRYTQG